MNVSIAVVTESNDFVKQIAQLLPTNLMTGICQVAPGSDLRKADIIVTDGCDPSVYEEEIPVFVIAENLPAHIRESLSIRFYKKGNFPPDVLSKDITEWAEIISDVGIAWDNASSAKKNEMMYANKLAEYEKSLLFAKNLQHAVMTDISLNGFELSSHYQPVSGVSGDFLFTKDAGDKVFIVIGDVTDHGYLAGLFGMALHAIINSYLSLASQFELTIEGLSNFVRYAAAKYQVADNTSLMQKTSATAIFCEIDKQKHIARFINCGHGNELPVLISKGEVSFVSFLKGESLEIQPPIGDMIPERSTMAIEIPFSYGDCLVFYTDGVTEVFKDPDNKEIISEYSKDRLLSSVLHEITKRGWSSRTITEGIIKDAESYSLSSELVETRNDGIINGTTDDATILTIKFPEAQQ